MCLIVALLEKVRVIGGDETDIMLAREAYELGQDLLLNINTVVLELDKDVVFPIDVNEVEQDLLGLFGLILEEPFLDGACDAGSQADEPFGVLAQQLPVDAGLVVEALEVGVRDEVDEILPAYVVLTEQHEMGGAASPRYLLAQAALRGGEVDLTAEDGLEDGLLLLGVLLVPLEDVAIVFLHIHHELNGGVDIAVIGDGNTIHPELGAVFDKILCVDHTI